MIQKYSSAKTSLKQIPMCIKKIKIKEGMTVLDFGCGKYDETKKYFENLGVNYFGYDPYNRTEEENEYALLCKPDLIICANVLNVIMEDEIIEEIVGKLRSYNCEVIIQIYEGDRSGKGKPTSKGYQRNQTALDYFPIISKHFNCFRKSGNIYFCEIYENH